MSNQYLLLDGSIREVKLTKREDGGYEDALSGAVYTLAQLERGGLYNDEASAYRASMARVATPGTLSRYQSYTAKRAHA